MTVSAIVLAAGAGTRMRSALPKPLHQLCGRSMVMHVLHALERLNPSKSVVVVGHGAGQVTEATLAQAPDWAHVTFATQTDQKGTGDAVAAGLSAYADSEFDDGHTIVVLPGDAPLLTPETLSELVETHCANSNAATVLSSVMDDPTGYGRVIRGDDGQVERIVEQKDGAPEELDVREVNTSMYAFAATLLGPALQQLDTDNAQGEYYLTDVVSVLRSDGHRVGCVQAPAAETQGVNDRWQLAQATSAMRERINRSLALGGATLVDPATTYVDAGVEVGQDVTIWPGTLLTGSTTIADGCEIGPHSRVHDCSIGERAVVRCAALDGVEIDPDQVVESEHRPDGH